MKGYIFYYFVENSKTKEKKDFIFFDWHGDINDYFMYNNEMWKILDYTIEEQVLEKESIY